MTYQFDKDGPLGFSLDVNYPERAMITKLAPNGQAETKGLSIVGQKVIKVNGRKTITFAEVMSAIKAHTERPISITFATYTPFQIYMDIEHRKELVKTLETMAEVLINAKEEYRQLQLQKKKDTNNNNNNKSNKSLKFR